MLALVRQWETSGETRCAFADRPGVTLSCVDCWRRQVREACSPAPERGALDRQPKRTAVNAAQDGLPVLAQFRVALRARRVALALVEDQVEHALRIEFGRDRGRKRLRT